MALYFASGAKEVWICDEAGVMAFHTSPTVAVEKSVLFPGFPEKI